MADDHGDHGREDHGRGAPDDLEHGVESHPAYDPTDKHVPAREPPLRGTAPQSPYTMRDVGVGVVVMLVGVALTFGLPLALV